MIHQSRSFRSSCLAVLLCGASVVSTLAQGAGGPPPGGGRGGRGGHQSPPPSPLFDALDTNHDGTISADEIANASTSLKSLLKDGTTEIRREDLRPAPPAPPHGKGQAVTDSDQPHPRPQGMRPHHPPMDDQRAPDAEKFHPPVDDAAAKSDGPAGGPADRPHHGPPASPLFDALDTNHDGTISADEMSNASASLKSLLKDGSTQLKREDLRPSHPPQRQEN